MYGIRNAYIFYVNTHIKVHFYVYVSIEHSNNSMECQNHPEESRMYNAYHMMLLRICLSINEQNIQVKTNVNVQNKPSDLSLT